MKGLAVAPTQRAWHYPNRDAICPPAVSVHPPGLSSTVDFAAAPRGKNLCFVMLRDGPPDSSPVAMGQLLPTVRAIAAEVCARVGA